MSPNSRTYNPVDAGTMLMLIGPPKSGKSYMARSATKLGKTFAFLAPSAELAGYAGCDVEYEVLAEEAWRPSERSFKANAYKLLMTKLKELEARDDLRCLIFDTMSAGPSEAIWHEIMSNYATDDPRELKNSREPYVTYRSRFTELMDRLDLLRFRKRVHIITCWHEDVRESEGLGTPRKEQEGTHTVVHWDVARLPMMLGGLRQDVAKWFDFAFYVEPVPNANPFRARLVCTPDATRQAGTRLEIVKELQALAAKGGVPNELPPLLDLVSAKYKGASTSK